MSECRIHGTYTVIRRARGTRKVTRKAPRGTRSELTRKVRASPRKVTCILARRRAKNACIATYSSCGSMRDCVEVSRVSRAASDAAWNRSCRAERRWGSNMRFHGGAGLPAGEAQRSGAGGWEWTLPETFSWYTPELGGLLLMLTGVRWNDRACIKCSAWSDHVFWRSSLHMMYQLCTVNFTFTVNLQCNGKGKTRLRFTRKSRTLGFVSIVCGCRQRHPNARIRHAQNVACAPCGPS